jgi:predicted DNA-binding protein with PD1-like motif
MENYKRIIRPSYTYKRTLLGTLPHGEDSYNGLSQIAEEEHITIGRITGLGATTFGRVAYYNQATRNYETLEFAQSMEILSCFGNITLRENKPFVHAHLVMSDREEKLFQTLTSRHDIIRLRTICR